MVNRCIYRMICIVLALSAALESVGQVHVSGIVRDSESGEVLIGANVFHHSGAKRSGQLGTITDNNGYYSLVLQQSKDTLFVSFVGYKTKWYVVKADTLLNIFLAPGREIEEVQVFGQKKTHFNQVRLSGKELIRIPSIGAEPDVLKTLQLMPGILSQNEGSSNLLIRGGGPGQNLFLIDNVPLYYVNHLGGFMSVFNPEVLNDVRVMKGGIPAKYGGKLSSVVDITMREGNQQGRKGSAGIGFVGANITYEGPLNDEMTFMVSARKTFTKVLFGLVSLMADQDYIVTYGFYDFNGKLTWKKDPKNTFHANLYVGDDQFSIFLMDDNDRMRSVNFWGNILGSLHWKHLLTSRLQHNTSLSYTRYRLRDHRHYAFEESRDSTFVFTRNYRTVVRDVTLKSDWRYRANRFLAFDFGLQSSALFFIPNDYRQNLYNIERTIEHINGSETSLYLENQLNLGSVVELNAGLRGVQYFTPGYTDFSLEPRIDLSLQASPHLIFNGTYMRVRQYANLVFSSGNFLNNEVWVPIQQGMDPASAQQYTAGVKATFGREMFSLEIDAYTKEMEDLLAFREGYANLRGDAAWRSKLETDGRGSSKGIEFLLRKNRGNWTGFLSYAYSHTTRQFDNINGGSEYIFEYDRPHSFSFDVQYKFNDHWEMNLLWVYQSGLPYTPAIARTYVPVTSESDLFYGYEALVYGERNSERMRPYHRLDVGLHYNTKNQRGRDARYSFSIYNTYNRKNPYFYFYNNEPSLNFFQYWQDDEPFLKLYQFSYFPIIPTLSYKVFF